MRSVSHPLTATFAAPMSTLGFGCAELLGRAARKQSMLALETAFDSGITFFDTARSYGFGGSEGLLGEFLATSGRREQVVLCTKFGIPAEPRNWKQHLRPVARAAVRLVPSLRQAVQRRAARQTEQSRFTVADLRLSFDTSLKQLRTSYVDILLLQAAPASVLEQDDLLEALTRLVEQGKVRAAGIAAGLDVIGQAFRQRPPVLQTAQFSLDPANLTFTAQTALHSDMLLIANHPFGGPVGWAALKLRLAALTDDATLPSTLHDKLSQTSDPQMLPELVFGLMLSETGIAAVLPAMMQPDHIRSNIAAVEQCRFSAEELAILRERLSTAEPAVKPRARRGAAQPEPAA